MVLLSVVGCGQNKHPELRRVTGNIVYQGKPVTDALVAFFNEKSPRPATGKTDASGNFYLTTFEDNDGALPGEHIVVVTKTLTNDDEDIAQPVSMDEAVTAPRRRTTKPQQLLPAHYGAVGTSPLRFNVSADESNELSIALSEKN